MNIIILVLSAIALFWFLFFVYEGMKLRTLIEQDLRSIQTTISQHSDLEFMHGEYDSAVARYCAYIDRVNQQPRIVVVCLGLQVILVAVLATLSAWASWEILIAAGVYFGVYAYCLDIMVRRVLDLVTISITIAVLMASINYILQPVSADSLSSVEMTSLGK